MKTACNKSVPFGDFKIFLRSNGNIIIPDLAEGLIPTLQQIGADPCLWEKSECAVTEPKLKRNRQQLPELIEEVRKRMQPCRLCERRCKVNRFSGEVGFCGLDHHLRLFACSNLYNEGASVGAPTFGVFLSGCAFRCRSCYRPENWNAGQSTLFMPECLASLLDDAATSGSQSWMVLGGNPDQSVLGILDALQFTNSDIPIVWNTALWSTPEILTVLREIVDIWIIDIKFGNNVCAVLESGVTGYVETIARNIERLKDETHVILRHGVQQKHIKCCTMPIRSQMDQIDYVTYFEHDIFDYDKPKTSEP
jgi:uncharacterized Fe-S radical SAM superfamily protein PflX